MSKYFTIIILLFFSCRSFPQKTNNDFARKEFLKNYNIVEQFVKYEKRTVPTKEILFLIHNTSIESFYFQGIDITYSPNQENLDAWKLWYEKNKDKLRWDDKLKKIYLE